MTFLLVLLGSNNSVFAQVTIQTSASADQNSASSTIVSPVFSTTGPNQLLLAFISTDQSGSSNTTVQGLAGANLNWVLVRRTNKEAGTSEIWRSFASVRRTNIRITATLSQSVVSSMTIMSFSGVPTAGANGSAAVGASASGYALQGAPAATLVTTQNNSLVVGVGNDWDKAIARTPRAGQTLVHQDLSSSQDTYWVQRLNASIPSKGTAVTLGDTGPTTDRYNLSICEVLPATSSAAGPQLTLSGSTLAFGNVNLNTTSTQALTLSSSGTSAVTVNSATLAGTGFTMSGAKFPATLNPGQTLNLQVSFNPKATGAASGKITIASNSSTGSTATVNLTGTGVSTNPVLSLSATGLSFGNDPINTAVAQTVTLTSTGTSPVTVSAATVKGAGFTFSGATFPVTLSPSVAIRIQVQFDPTVVGAASGTLTFSSNSTTASTSTVSLSGTGTAAAHEVSLSWAAPASSPVKVEGYNIYRATGSSTSYQRLDSQADTQTSYVDSSVQSAMTYSYYVTSIASTGTESAPSKPVTVKVP